MSSGGELEAYIRGLWWGLLTITPRSFIFTCQLNLRSCSGSQANRTLPQKRVSVFYFFMTYVNIIRLREYFGIFEYKIPKSILIPN